jgi:hypothetical protein
MVYKKIVLAVASSLVILGGLYGCGKKESHNTPPNQPTSNPSQTKNTALSNTPPPPAAAAAGALSKADLTVPLSSYQQLGTDAPHWMAMYYGIANVNPLPFGKFADIMVNGYQYEQNPFTKQNELKQIVPEVTQMVAASAKNKYYVMLANVSIGNYDMATKAFPIQAFSGGSAYQQGNYGLTFSNGSQFSSYPVSNQATAEGLENTLQSMGNGSLAKVYFYAQGIEYSMSGLPKYTTVGQITKVVFYPPNNTTTKLFELGSSN